MTLRILSTWHGADDSPYGRMANVLAYTAKKYHEHVMVTRLSDECANRSEAFKRKARNWTDAIKAAEPLNQSVLCLLDTDTFFQRPITDIQRLSFDIAVTSHGGLINSGVLFVRPSSAVSDFFLSWEARTARYCARNTPEDIRWGDQDALEDMICEAGGLNILYLPMTEWNSTQRTWNLNLAQARIVHFKSAARAHVFGGRPCNEIARKVANLWRALEKEARNA